MSRKGEERPPIQDFYDEALLSDATKNIIAMDNSELQRLADFLAECSSGKLMQNDLIQNKYDVACDRYLIEFENNRPMDRLIVCSTMVASVIRTKILVPRCGTKRERLSRALARDRRCVGSSGSFFKADS
jgi:hypothetical protein